MDLSELIGSLSEQDMQKLQETASAFFGAQKEAPPKEETALSLPGFTPELLGQAAKISSALSKSDPRSDFMLALKPLLSPGRQKKADEAAMMIKLFGVLGAMREGRQ